MDPLCSFRDMESEAKESADPCPPPPPRRICNIFCCCAFQNVTENPSQKNQPTIAQLTVVFWVCTLTIRRNGRPPASRWVNLVPVNAEVTSKTTVPTEPTYIATQALRHTSTPSKDTLPFAAEILRLATQTENSLA